MILDNNDSDQTCAGDKTEALPAMLILCVLTVTVWVCCLRPKSAFLGTPAYLRREHASPVEHMLADWTLVVYSWSQHAIYLIYLKCIVQLYDLIILVAYLTGWIRDPTRSQVASYYVIGGAPVLYDWILLRLITERAPNPKICSMASCIFFDSYTETFKAD